MQIKSHLNWSEPTTAQQLSTTKIALILPILLIALLCSPAGFAAEWMGSVDCRAQLLDSDDEDDLPGCYEGKIVGPVSRYRMVATGATVVSD